MVKLNIIGNILDFSGYSRHTRFLANALNDLGHEVRLDFPKTPQWERYVTDAELNMAMREFTPDYITVCISQPQFWRLALADRPKKFFGFCVFEGDKIPDYWLEYLLDERVDGILVPSEHTKKAVCETLKNYANSRLHQFDENWNKQQLKLLKKYIEKISIIPHGVDLSKYHPMELEELPDNFVFMANKGWSKGIKDRGGIQWLIKAFLEEFTNKDMVELRVKINATYNKPDWDISQEIINLGIEKTENRPKLLITNDNMDDNLLCKFYNEGDVFVSCSMADAFDIPPLEAMACGLPCLVTANNGHCDFVTPINGWIIEEGEFVDNWSGEEEYKEIKWFKPDLEILKSKLRGVYESDIEEKSKYVLEMASKFQWSDSAKKLIEVIK